MFEPNFIPDTPKGFAPIVHKNASDSLDLIIDHDIFSRDFYRKADTCSTLYYTKPAKVSEDSVMIITQIIPLLDNDGHLKGQFWLDIKLDELSEMTRKLVDFKYSEICLVDSDFNIIFNSDSQYNGKNVLELGFSDKYVSLFKNLINARKPASLDIVHFGRKNELRVFPIEPSDFTLAMFFPYKTTHEELNKLRSTLLFVSILGMALMLLFSGIAFKKFSKENNERIAIEKEISIAEGIQRNFIPPTEFKVGDIILSAGNWPAKQVGGDLYDYALVNDTLYFCVGDVSGKGIPASFDGCEIVEMTANRPLGLVKDTEFNSETLNIKKGDKLFIYSDGVTEARASDRKLFGTKRLVSLLSSLAPEASASEAVVTVVKSVNKFSPETEQSDDITILCIQV